MVIDFHTHVYPDQIAARTIEALQRAAAEVHPYTDGTVSGGTKTTLSSYSGNMGR